MSYGGLHLDARTSIARTSIAAWNALMRADPVFGRYALSEVGRSAFIAAFTVVKNGTWTVGGKRHRADMPGSGGPARTRPNGTMEWYAHGRRHRIGGPARIYTWGIEEWFEHGQLHRIGGPARMCADGAMEWWDHGELHRIGGPAIVYANGHEEWYEHNELHRIDGPAIIHADGREVWYVRDKMQSDPARACAHI